MPKARSGPDEGYQPHPRGEKGIEDDTEGHRKMPK